MCHGWKIDLKDVVIWLPMDCLEVWHLGQCWVDDVLLDLVGGSYLVEAMLVLVGIVGIDLVVEWYGPFEIGLDLDSDLGSGLSLDLVAQHLEVYLD